MSTQVVAGPPALDAAPDLAQAKARDQIECAPRPAPSFLHSPPDSNNTVKSDASDSELSDLDEEPILDDAPTLLGVSQPNPEPEPESKSLQQEAPAPHIENAEEEDIGEVLPDHWTNGVPVFKPTMKQFHDFKLFMRKVDSYGMRSGIIKIVPPEEWKAQQPELDDLVKQIKVREPIKQDIMGSNGTYRQVNILHGRSYNLPQWRQLCEQSEHQPPARRGERRANADKPKPTRTRQAAATAKTASSLTPAKRRRGRPARGRGKKDEDERPMTPISPKIEPEEIAEAPVQSIEEEAHGDADEEESQPTVGRMGAVKPAKSKTQSTSARRKYSRREGSAVIDEAAFKDFDYRMDISDYTAERCEELERSYWKTLTYAAPLYGADLMGTLFDERTENWNLNKLPNILDVLGTKVPGVNTAYLYLGMWKATFAWHLEDVDLYSINYLHFGAPKQWYSISQGDARKFEAAMKSIWPTDAKACDQFLRHKAFLISPQHLLQNFGIKVNKCLSYPGEFVVTYPYGYHSGYNLGYNCAEAVNFALDSWLDMGKIAKKCECAQAQDSVWINVYEIERKLRGEETEYEETEDEEDDDDEGDDDEIMSGLPTPPASHNVKFKTPGRKRKRGAADAGAKVKVKKIKLRLKPKVEPPCCLCPNDIASMQLLPTDHGMKAHKICAMYLPETYIETVDGQETVFNVSAIHKDRLDLKCVFCRSKRGACFQCSQKKCARSYHATCAAAGGLFVEEADVPVFGEDGTEYKEQAFEFSCRFHRTKRDRKLDGDALEADERIRSAAKALKKDDVCQMQYHKGEIFAGVVVENRSDEEMLLLDILPHGDRLEVEWKWLLLPDPADYHLPKASSTAIPMPTSRKAQEQLNAKRQGNDKPRKDDVFVEGYTWAEFHAQDVRNKEQAKVDLDKPDQVWFFLPKKSTDARAQYTEDPSKPQYNPKGNFLDTIPKPPKPVQAVQKPPRALPAAHTYAFAGPGTLPVSHAASSRSQKPYVYKPKIPAKQGHAQHSQHTFATFTPTHMPASVLTGYNTVARSAGPNQGYTSQKFDVKPGPSPTAHQPMAGYQSWQQQASNASTPAVKQHVIQMTYGSSPYAPKLVPQHTAQQKKHTWQVYSSVYQKYPFFQVHHNRDSSKYRTPYATWGGFTNGYQGDLRAHLSNHNDLLRRASMPGTQFKPGYTVHGAHPPAQNVASQQYLLSSPPGDQAVPGSQQNHVAPNRQSLQVGHYPVQYAQHNPPPISHHSQQTPQPVQLMQPSQQPQTAVKPKPKPAATPKSYKVPSKQSPVPLPANFLASMSGPATPASSKLSQSVEAEDGNTAGSAVQPTMTEVTSDTAMASSPVTQAPPATPQDTPSAAKTSGKVSTTPVPLPKLPGMTPYQAASRAQAASPDLAQPNNAPADVPKAGLLQKDQPIHPPAHSDWGTDKHAPAPMEQTAGQMASEPSLPPNTADHDVPNDAVSQLDRLEPTWSNGHQESPNVPGHESMEFVERMMQNLRRASQYSESA